MRAGAFVGFIVLMFALRIHAIASVAYDPDEFEHLQAGLMFAGGSVPYRDFFEHHGPLTYLIAWLPAKLLGPTTDLLIVNRVLSLAFVVATCWATYPLGVLVAGKQAAPWSLVWLLTMPWFADKSLEWRPDVPAMAFLTFAALAATGKRAMLAGLLVAAATLCTQKSGALGVGIAVALMWHSESWKRMLLRIAVGFAVPWLAAAAAFASVDGLGALLKCLIYIPAAWPSRVIVGPAIFAIAVIHSPASLALGIAAFIECAFKTDRRPRAPAWDSVRIPILLHWLSWPLVPLAYMQFHLLALPLLSAAVGLLLRPAAVRHWRRLPWALLLLLPNLHWFWMQQWSAPRSAAVTQAVQMDAVLRLGTIVPRTARVQAGSAGPGCLHARADYWWCIDEHALKLMERLGELPAFRARLRRNPPDALLLDGVLRNALEPLAREIERDYEVVERNDAMRYFLLKKK